MCALYCWTRLTAKLWVQGDPSPQCAVIAVGSFADFEFIRKHQHVLDILDQLAQRVLQKREFRAKSIEQRLDCVNSVLFDEFGLYGSVSEYYNDQNSYIQCVLTRKCGIPISLSAVYLLVAERVGIDLHGINSPGHFLLRYKCENVTFYIDAFNKGRRLSEEDASLFLSTQTRMHISATDLQNIDVCTSKQWALRMFRNILNLLAGGMTLLNDRPLSEIERNLRRSYLLLQIQFLGSHAI
jgi:regulator of sirC expression with transglutaminase-like and TPR domain